MDLVLQSEVEGEILNALVGVDLDFGSIFISLQVLDDIREPDRQTIVPGGTQSHAFLNFNKHGFKGK